MTTQTTIRENQAWLRGQDHSVNLIFQPSARVQWYRADGTPLPNLLPCDPHHMAMFRKNGWTLKPFEAVAGAPALVLAEEPSGVLAEHRHRYGKTLGAPCKVAGCTAIRQRLTHHAKNGKN